ncbi:MAG: YfhO family protein, partial [bacterium]|nr:YfhO family protein [bacterium]
WNPYSFSGIPIFADPQSGFFNPIHLILFGLLNPGIAFGIDLALHFLLAGWFTYLFIKHLGTSRFAAILAGICYMFSGFLVPKILLPPLVFSAIYLPFLLLSIERLFTKPSFANMVLISVGITLLIFSGYPQYIMTILLFSAIYATLRLVQFSFAVEKKADWPKSTRLLATILFILFILITAMLILFTSIPEFRKLVQLPVLISTCGWSLVFILFLIWLLSVNRIKWNRQITFAICGFLLLSTIIALLLSMVYLFPAYELYQQSTRAGLPTTDYVRGIFFLQNLPIIVQDLFTGKGMNDFEISGSIGATPLVLIIFTFALGLLHIQFRKYAVIFWLFLWLSSSLVFLEPQLVSFVMRYVPVVNHFFVFHRYLLIAVFSLAILAGFAMHNLMEYIQKQNPVQIAKLNYRYLLPLVSGFIILVLLFSFLNKTFLLLKILPGIGILLIYLITTGQGLVRRLFPIAVVLITVIELHPKTVGYPLDYVRPSQLYPAKTIYTVLKETDPDLYRVFSIEDEQVPLPSKTSAISHFLVPNVATIYQARDIQGYNPVILRNYREYIDYLNQENPQRHPYEDRTHFAIANSAESKLVDLLNVKYIISFIPLSPDKFELVYGPRVTIDNQSRPQGRMPKVPVIFISERL